MEHIPTQKEWTLVIGMGKDKRPQIVTFGEFICAVPSREAAEKIVKAVNAHDELVEALKSTLKCIQNPDEDYFVTEMLEERILKALSKAGA